MQSLKLAALVAMIGASLGGGAEVIQRPIYYDSPLPMGYTRTRRMGNNRKPGMSFAAKKRIRKIARASRRFNLRTGA